MTKNIKYLTRNAKLVCAADFFWNLGRTFPHAILTIFLLEQGFDLVQIATLQSVFMIVAMVTEFPSGIWADLFGRKQIYMAAVVTLFCSYLLIGFFSDHFIVILFAYVLYGLSVALKSGTLEAEVVLEFEKEQRDIKAYSVASSYVMSISSIVGGLLGSLFYEKMHSYMYAISLMLFVLAFLMAALCVFSQTSGQKEREQRHLRDELKVGFCVLKSSKPLLYMILLFASATLFVQPFFQYWQVLYQKGGIPVRYFGIIYVAFQACNLVGTMIYNRMKMSNKKIMIFVWLIAIIFAFSMINTQLALFLLPVSVILFYVFYQHLDVLQKKVAPKQFMSSFFSLVGTSENIASIVSLFIMATCIEYVGITYAYIILFFMFSVCTYICYLLFLKDK